MVQEGDQVAAPTVLQNDAFEVDYTGENGDLVTPGHQMVGRDSLGKSKFPIYNWSGLHPAKMSRASSR